MGKHDSKITRAAHIKHHTVGTSNEISFSVLDAAKNAMDGGSTPSEAHRFGAIPIFTLPGRKKTVATPKKERGLHLPGGGFVSTEEEGSSSSDSFGSSRKGRKGSSKIALPLPKASSKSAASGAQPTETPASASSSSSWVAPANEVAAKKRSRKTRKFLATAAAFVVAAACIGAGGYWLYNNHLIYQDNIGQLNRAVALINEADKTMLVLDEQVQFLIDGEEGPLLDAEQQRAMNATRAALPDAEVHLQNAIIFANNAITGLADSIDKEAAQQVVTSVQARQSMIEPALALMDHAVNITDAASIAQDAWQVLLDADALARAAAAYLADPTKENLQESISKTKQALSKLKEADSLFSSAQNAYPTADYSVYREYIAKREEAFSYAIASDQALIERNKEEALAKNEAYSTADAEAAEIAKDLPRKSDAGWRTSYAPYRPIAPTSIK